MNRAFLFRNNTRFLVLITAVLVCVFLLCYFGFPLFRKMRESQAAYAKQVTAAKRVESQGARVNWNNGTVQSVYIERGSFPIDMADALSELPELLAIDQLVEVPSDRAIAKLTKLGHLEIICFGGPGIKDTTLGCLKDVKGLRDLSLQDTDISDAGLAHFADFASLEYLKIDGGAITDAGVSYLSNLQNLKGLDLRNIALTDSGLDSLKSLKHLKTLRLYECKQITGQGIQTLKQALPKTSIGWDKSAIPGDFFQATP